ncbi:hypothetical protein [Hymenobacter cheonanensis]|uniref:hypothetical protein n=1 Tax=Hymenobacter sp. CA2-7 TaxID=3063993 RepID=UPI002712C52E|nr:hypothetical protein [Hymenobacter sp. CA2-7]MDO7884388.1 hypothetical protein [Hymenobacter sp. CA2-7]
MMELKDLFLTPIYLGIFYAIAFAVRPSFTNKYTKPYFIPALTVKFVGAIALGLIYQFYYGAGDTFNYFSESKVIYGAFGDSFSVGLSLLGGNDGTYSGAISKYASQMHWFGSPTEYFVIRVGAFCALFCFCTYTVIGLMFAIISFSGIWCLYVTFLRIAPASYKELAFAVFFLPSVFFWGSGLMKDSLCIGAIGWTFYGFYRALIIRRTLLKSALVGLLGVYVLSSVKVYILLSFLPPALLWAFNEYNQNIKSAVVRNMLRPFFLALGLAAGYLGATNLTAGDDKYDVEKIGERTKINQEFLYALTKDQGSSYNIGSFDGSLGSMVKVAPQAIIVTLFRPFLWEARNPIMMLSALEALMLLWLTARLLWSRGIVGSFRQIANQPVLTFCFLFSIIFAIGVGTNSGNFGTLVRYKIPLMPFYLSALFIMGQPLAKKAVQRARLATAA